MNRPLIIIPDTQEKNIPDGTLGRFSFTYLHGKLETDCEYDCYSVIGFEQYGFELRNEGHLIKEDNTKTGIYPCTYNDKDCTLFLWFNDNHYHGLVTYNDDTKYYDDAKNKYDCKEIVI